MMSARAWLRLVAAVLALTVGIRLGQDLPIESAARTAPAGATTAATPTLGVALNTPTVGPGTPAAPLPTPTVVVMPTEFVPAPTPTVAPATSAPPPTTHQLNLWRTVPYVDEDDCGERITVCQQFADIYAPADAGRWPVVVMVHGRPRTPADLAELARAVAARGAVVYNIDYRGVRPVVQKGWPYAVDDVACAVRFARATAWRYGGDPARVVVVGHSFGGYVGTLVSLAGNKFNGECLTPDMSALPDAWVGISANCLVGVPPPPSPLWTTWYGGTNDEIPRVWEKGDPLKHIGGNPALVVRMVHEEDDPVVSVVQPRELVDALSHAGYDARLTVIDGDDHWGPLDPDEDAGKVSLDTIMDLLQRDL